jgi:simple sugar transport system permease protein
VYLPLRAGLWNIGAEGQLYLGALAGTWVGLNVDGPTLVVIPLALLGAGIAGGFWGLIPGYLRAKRGVNEIIATLMLTFVGVRLVGYLVRGPMAGGRTGFPGTDSLPSAARLPDLPIPVIGEPHAGVLVAITAVAVIRLLVSRTELGYEIAVTGSNPRAARGAGMNTAWIYVVVLVLGGALAGVAGVVEVAGVQGNLEPEFSPGYGFTAIPIALLGRKGALRVGVAGLFFALLFVGGTSATLDVPAAIVDVIQSLVILFLITAEFFKRYRIELHRPGASGASAAAGEAD